MRLPNGRTRPIACQPIVTDCQRDLRRLRSGYVRHGLTWHEQKAVWRRCSVVAWGVASDGKRGAVNVPFGRVLFLAGITAEVAALGYASVELLMSLVGSWMSAMLCRRRSLCLLELIYEAMRGREMEDVLRLSGRLRMELLSLVIMASFLRTDLRAVSSSRLFQVDASSKKSTWLLQI